MSLDSLSASSESETNGLDKSVSENTLESQPLKKQQVFDSDKVKLQSASDELKSAQAFAPQTPLKAVDEVVDDALAAHPQALDVSSIRPTLHQSRRWSWLARFSVFGLLLLVLVQTGLGLRDAWLASPWLFSFYGAVLGLVGS